jgi:ferritin-like metal-binding protein YciE
MGLALGGYPFIREIVMAAKKEKTLDDLFEDTLKDIFYAENKILKALPKMAKAAQSDELKAAFQKHAKETEGHVARLEKVFRAVGKPARGKKCEAIEGILEEGTEIMKEFKGAPALDAGLVSAAQAVEHYEIARYGSLIAWAKQLGRADCASVLQRTLDEEKATDRKLTQMAESAVNLRAAS